MERINQVYQYLYQEKGLTELATTKVVDKIIKYEDILADFCYWLEMRDYYNDEAVVVEGYSAQAIVDALPMLDGIGAFNLLVDLRDRPKEALKILKEGVEIL